MVLKLKFVQIDVFTEIRFLGNPLAIVHLPDGFEITQDQKQSIAREFNLSETVFLHEPIDHSNSPTVIDIFTTTEELPFAGHPTVGSGWYLLSQGQASAVLRTKAGDIPVVKELGAIRVEVPIDFKVHSNYDHPNLRALQPHLLDHDYTNSPGSGEAVVSIVKGLSFILLHLATETALARLQPFPERLALPEGYLGEWDGEWGGAVGVYAFVEGEGGAVRTRMFLGSLEDPATGSAASTLSGWLAKKKGQGRWKFDIVQGVEMGRKSEIGVVVEVGNDGNVQKIELEGKAVEVTEGWIQV